MTGETIDLRRVGIALFVVVLHGLLIMVLLRETIQRTERAPEAKEVILNLARPSPPSAPRPSIVPSAVPLLAPTAPVAPFPGIAPPTVPPNGASLRGLYFFLYECRPENFANLTEAERARCTAASLGPVPNETNALRNLPSRAHGAVHWLDELAREKKPFGVNPPPEPTQKSLNNMLECAPKGAPQTGPADVCNDGDSLPGYRNTR